MALKLRPSDASRWMVCTASPGFIDRHQDELPEDTSTYADEGTVAHDLAAASLVMGFDPGMFPSKDMAKHVKGYVEVVQGWAAKPGATLSVESFVPLFYDRSRNGFIDATVIHDSRKIFIGDLKYGAGVSVKAKENKQLAIYAMSVINELLRSGLYDFDNNTLVTLMIYQPRILGEQAIRLWALSLKELRTFCEKIEVTASRIKANPTGGTFAPSDDTCQFCPAVSICSARAAQLLGETPVESLEVVTPNAPLAFPAIESLTVDQVVRLVQVAPAMKAWLNKAEAFGASLLHAGKPFPGFKLVAGRSNRTWTDDEEVIRVCVENGYAKLSELYNKELLSPAQLEELLKDRDCSVRFKNKIQSLITKPEGKPIMVPEDDAREPFKLNPADIFENLDAGINLLE